MPAVTVYEGCRHLVARTTPAGTERSCRLGAGVGAGADFSCTEGCLFLEARMVDDAGWVQAPAERMSNTADALADLPKPKKPKRRKRT